MYAHLARTLRSRRLGRWLSAGLVVLLLAACGAVSNSVPSAAPGGATTTAATAVATTTTSPATKTSSSTSAPAPAVTSPTATPPASPTVAGVGQSSPAATWTPAPNTGTIAGTVTDRDTGKPVPAVYITVGYKSVMLTTLTDEVGHYIVRNVPAGQPADVFGFHGGGFRYHNSLYDDNLHIMVQSGQTYRYDFQVYQLNDPAGEPHVDHPAINPASAAPGQTVTFSLTASDGKGGLSDEVMAASPTLGRLVLLKPAGGDNFGGSFTIPDQTAPGDYAFAFFAASNDCYDNHTFPRLTLHVTAP